MSQKINVVILGGGDSSEHDVSVKTAHQVANNLPGDLYDAQLMLIEKGQMRRLHEHMDILRAADIIFLALHGKGGEDGVIQGFFDTLGIRYTGSGVLASALAMDKQRAAALVAKSGILVPRTLELRVATWRQEMTQASEMLDALHYPLIVKPNSSGSSVGVSMASTREQVEAALAAAFREDETVLVQEFVRGREFTCAVLGGRALPPVEIVAHQEFFNYEAKYSSNATEEICPAPVDDEVTRRIQDIALRAHRELGCEGLTRTDMMMNETGDLYYLETNTLPGLTEMSLAPKEARAAGMSFGELLHEIVRLGLEKYSGR